MKTPPGSGDVGYGRPPKHSQFKPNQSGNPAGRPKGSKNTRTLIRSALDERVRVTTNGVARWMTKREIAAQQQVTKAASGDLKAFLVVNQLDENDPRGGAATGRGGESEIPTDAYEEIVRQFLADFRDGGAS